MKSCIKTIREVPLKIQGDMIISKKDINSLISVKYIVRILIRMFCIKSYTVELALPVQSCNMALRFQI